MTRLDKCTILLETNNKANLAPHEDPVLVKYTFIEITSHNMKRISSSFWAPFILLTLFMAPYNDLMRLVLCLACAFHVWNVYHITMDLRRNKKLIEWSKTLP